MLMACLETVKADAAVSVSSSDVVDAPGPAVAVGNRIAGQKSDGKGRAALRSTSRTDKRACAATSICSARKAGFESQYNRHAGDPHRRPSPRRNQAA
jgi:hypothetical protein